MFLSLAFLAGGNCNNGAHVGADYLNLNNDAGNANWNIGASIICLKSERLTKCSLYSSPHGENYSGYRIGRVSICTKTDRR